MYSDSPVKYINTYFILSNMEFLLTYIISDSNIKQTNQSRHYEQKLKEQVGM